MWPAVPQGFLPLKHALRVIAKIGESPEDYTPALHRGARCRREQRRQLVGMAIIRHGLGDNLPGLRRRMQINFSEARRQVPQRRQESGFIHGAALFQTDGTVIVEDAGSVQSANEPRHPGAEQD